MQPTFLPGMPIQVKQRVRAARPTAAELTHRRVPFPRVPTGALRHAAKALLFVTVIQGEGDDATYASGSWKISYQSTNKSWGPFQLTVDADDKPFAPGKSARGGWRA